MLSATTGSVDSDFLTRAKLFFGAAERLANDAQHYAPVVRWLVWHSSELALKALSVDHNLERDHDLEKLMDHLKANNAVDKFTWVLLQDQVVKITSSESYNELRYPGKEQLFLGELSISGSEDSP